MDHARKKSEKNRENSAEWKIFPQNSWISTINRQLLYSFLKNAGPFNHLKKIVNTQNYKNFVNLRQLIKIDFNFKNDVWMARHLNLLCLIIIKEF